ncbi:MAG TPA: hypothetical protein DCQ37_06370 [Desulfobacteraceae bacterium]|nr:hypothetical protein [Desulfobacteraceae bacterium]
MNHLFSDNNDIFIVIVHSSPAGNRYIFRTTGTQEIISHTVGLVVNSFLCPVALYRYSGYRSSPETAFDGSLSIIIFASFQRI